MWLGESWCQKPVNEQLAFFQEFLEVSPTQIFHKCTLKQCPEKLLATHWVEGLARAVDIAWITAETSETITALDHWGYNETDKNF